MSGTRQITTILPYTRTESYGEGIMSTDERYEDYMRKEIERLEKKNKSALKLQELVKERIKNPDTNMNRGTTLLQSLLEESEK